MKNPFDPNELLTPGIHFLSIGHDDGCLTIETQRDADCTCQSVTLTHHQDEKRFAAIMEQNRAQRRKAKAVALRAIKKAQRRDGDV